MEFYKIRNKLVKKWYDHLCPCGWTYSQMESYLADFTNLELARPFVKIDIENGVSRQIILDRYDLTIEQYRTIGIQCGVFRPR